MVRECRLNQAEGLNAHEPDDTQASAVPETIRYRRPPIDNFESESAAKIKDDEDKDKKDKLINRMKLPKSPKAIQNLQRAQHP